MIRATNLRKSFGSVVAVDDVSFTAPDGVVTGVAQGRTVISATSEGRSATIDLAVVGRNTRLLVAFADSRSP